MTPVSKVRGVGPAMERALQEKGITKAEELAVAPEADLLSLRGLGPHRVRTIRTAAADLIAATPAAPLKPTRSKVAKPAKTDARGKSAEVVKLVPIADAPEPPAKEKKPGKKEERAIKARQKARKAVREFEAELKRARAKLAKSEAKLAKAEAAKPSKKEKKKG